MRNKVGLVFGIMMLVMIASVLATAGVFNTPEASAIVVGTYKVNATMDTTYLDVSRCNLSITSASTANSTSFAYKTLLNYTANQTEYNVSIGSTQFEDASDYVFLFTCASTNGTSTITRTGVTIDNTVPTAPTGLTTTKQTGTSFTLNSTVTGARTTSCTISYNSGGNVLAGTEPAGTHSGGNCTFSVTNAKEYPYKYIVIASDGLNTTASAEASFDVEFPKGIAQTYMVKQKVITEPTTATVVTMKAKSFWQSVIDFIKGLFR